MVEIKDLEKELLEKGFEKLIGEETFMRLPLILESKIIYGGKDPPEEIRILKEEGKAIRYSIYTK